MALLSNLTFKKKIFIVALINAFSLALIGLSVYFVHNATLSFGLIAYILVVGILNFFLINSFNSTVATLQTVINYSKKLSEGSLTNVKLPTEGDEEIVALSGITKDISKTYSEIVTLANEIGNKNFDFDFKPKSPNDDLGKAMVSMKDSLRIIAEKDAQQNWISAGLAKFSDILRQDNQSLEQLSFSIISNLCRYMDANQGGLFVLEDQVQGNEYLELKAYFAYNKQKFIEKRIDLQKEGDEYIVGEGLVGQAFVERSTLYFTDIPEDYVKITSGLGEALPRNIIIVPLKYNETIVGVIELALFRVLKEYEVTFVEKLGEQIASTIVAANVSTRTKKLLDESQIQAQELRKKEEEMKQNYEELTAIQEELTRNERELMQLKENLEDEVRAQTAELEIQKEELLKNQQLAVQKEKQVLAILNGAESAIFLCTEEDGIIQVANEATSMLTGYSMSEIIGLDYHKFLTAEKIRMGRPVRLTLLQKSGTEINVEVLINKIGIDGVKNNLFYISDITEILKKENKFNDKIAALEAELAELKATSGGTPTPPSTDSPESPV